MNLSNGIVLVDKPVGFTSHDIVDFIRKKFRFKKVGHAGTLDPFATRLLIILLGKFTKKSIQFSSYDKEYEGRLCLGISTDTGDKEGKVISKKDLDSYNIDQEGIKEIFMSFKGEIEQIPPMYSAKKIKGKKLYELARTGVVLKREPKKVNIEKIEVLDIALPFVNFNVKCSKGTYIRQLACDIGEKIGCGAHLVSLRRTNIGPLSVKEALPFEKLKEEDLDINENILQSE